MNDKPLEASNCTEGELEQQERMANDYVLGELKRQEIRDEAAQVLKRQIMRHMGTHSGVGGFMELLTDLCWDLGEGLTFPGSRITPDPLWSAIASEVARCRDNIERILEEYS